MESSSVPTTASKCTSETATDKHVFKIVGYHNIDKGLGVGEYVRSATFAIGGNDWCVHYYPNGDTHQHCRGYVSVYLMLLTRSARVRVEFGFSLIDSGSMPPSSVTLKFANDYGSVDQDEDPHGYGGADTFLKRSEVQSYVRGDCLVIECKLKVIKQPHVQEETALGPVESSQEIAGWKERSRCDL